MSILVEMTLSLLQQVLLFLCFQIKCLINLDHIKVYPTTKIIPNNIVTYCLLIKTEGKDATEDFEDAGHSKDARELMEKFCIGDLDTSPIPELEITSKKQGEDYAKKLVNLTKQHWAIPASIVGISVIVGFLYLRKK